MNLTNRKNIIEILKKHNLWAKKRFSQNFLTSTNALKTIVTTAKITSDDHIIEIGPGLGTLTKELAKKAKKVTAIELDQTLLPVLKKNLGDYKNIKIIQKDALKFTPPANPYKVTANIPYNITSPLINHFLQAKNKPKSLTLLVQKEVAKKICRLQPDMSILSLQTALFGKAKYIKTVKKSAFFPSPKVDSAVIHIKVYKKDDPNYIPTKEALKILKKAKKAFSQKRKKISNTLENIPNNIDPNRRPQTLSTEEWKSFIK